MRRKQRRRPWSDKDIARLRRLFPKKQSSAVAKILGRPTYSVNNKAWSLGLRKDKKYLARLFRRLGRKLQISGAPFRFPNGLVPFNKGVKGWYSGGRSAETWFKKGQPNARWKDDYPVGVLRVNSCGYIDMKIKEGLRAWRLLHYILWEDAHGPVPKGHCLRFKDGDRLNVELRNLRLISRRTNMLRNTIHNLPPALASTIHLLGQLNRRIREKQDRRSAQPSV
jgi:hypothetical protein